MFQLQVCNCRGNSRRFHQIVFGRSTALHRTECTGPGADVAQNHEGRGSVLAPTFRDVGAHCILANSVESVRANDVSNFEECFAARYADLQPIRSLAHICIAILCTFSTASWKPSESVGWG